MFRIRSIIRSSENNPKSGTYVPEKASDGQIIINNSNFSHSNQEDNPRRASSELNPKSGAYGPEGASDGQILKNKGNFFHFNQEDNPRNTDNQSIIAGL